MRLEHLGIIGNCQFTALIDAHGAVVWCCLPRFDSEPMFGSLLDEKDGGDFVVQPPDGTPGRQAYLPNTNILVTEFRTPDGAFRVTDFAPRFELHGRSFRPTQLVRLIEPVDGAPMVRVRCAPRLGWSKAHPEIRAGSNHIDYDGFAAPVRLTTDVPLAHLDGRPFLLTGPRHLLLSWGAPVEEPLQPLVYRSLGETRRCWQRWVKECNLPPLFQQEVLRSALVLKLHCYEDTGAIVAAMTTSIPEAPGSGRTWDYRYCWLRDAFYALRAFRRLGHFEERERFLEYLLQIVAAEPDLRLAPLYRIDGRADLDESIMDQWAGFGDDGPVRVGNAAGRQTQHDIYGELVLALAPIFLDDRFEPERTPAVFSLIERLARRAAAVAGRPDAGIWEVRREATPQTFSSLMCWAATDRMAHLAARHRPELEAEFTDAAARIRTEILTRGWSEALGGLVSTYGGADLDASLLQAVTLRLFQPGDPRARQAVEAVRRDLTRDGFLLRYAGDDGLGTPSTAFLICNFWLTEALAHLGMTEDARQVFQDTLRALSPLGLLSEDYDPGSGRLWGNFPQAYSHVGLIHAAFASSPTWEEFL